MAKLDLAGIRNRMNALSGKSNENTNVWKPTEGETKIRIVPRKGSPENPFKELFFYYKLVQGKTILSPLSYDERDPIQEFGESLLSGARVSKEEFKYIKNTYFPAIRTYAPIVVRGQESEGVKEWAFGKTTLDEIVKIMENEEYGDITDIENGFDLTVTFTPADKSDTGFAKTKVVPSRKETPLTKDKALLETLLTQQKDVLEATGFRKYTTAELKNLLDRAINPESAPAAVSPLELATEEPTVVKAAGTTTKLSASAEEEFDKLFDA